MGDPVRFVGNPEIIEPKRAALHYGVRENFFLEGPISNHIAVHKPARRPAREAIFRVADHAGPTAKDHC